MAPVKKPHILTADEIWAANDIEERFVPIPQWGSDEDGNPKGVLIRTLDKLTADRMTAAATRTDPRTKQQETDNDMLVALLFVESMIEPKIDLEGYEKMRKKSAVAVALLQRAILDASGMTAAAIAEATKSAVGQPATALRVLPGARVEDDEGGIAEANVGP